MQIKPIYTQIQLKTGEVCLVFSPTLLNAPLGFEGQRVPCTGGNTAVHKYVQFIVRVKKHTSLHDLYLETDISNLGCSPLVHESVSSVLVNDIYYKST